MIVGQTLDLKRPAEARRSFSRTTTCKNNMTELSQPPPQPKPKSLLQAHQDAHVLVKALNEFAASQQMPVSRHMMSNQTCSSSSRASMRFLPPKSTSSDSSPAGQGDPSSSAPASRPVNGSGIPVLRRRLRQSEQPTVAMLGQLGVKVRDFAYESTLPPVPTVYLQPRQIQPSVPKDVNDPNDPHYVLEEERKKKVYTFQSTRKIERTPTEPVLESDLLPPPRRSFPKIKRADALLDFGSQSQSQPQPAPTHLTLPYDITNTSFSASQPQPAHTRQAGTWVETPVATPNGSLQWPSAKTMGDQSFVPPPQLETSRADSQNPNSKSYYQMGLADSKLRPQSSGTRAPNLSHSSSAIGLVPTTLRNTASAGHEPFPSVSHSSFVPASLAEHSRKRSPLLEPPPSSSATPSRYHLRNTKRRAESSHPPPSARSSLRSRPQRSPNKAVNPSIPVSTISSHKASANVISTGRTMKRARTSSFSNGGEEGLRRSKRRTQRS